MSDAPRRVGRGERGILLLGILVGLLVLGILSGVAVQRWSVVMRRDREAELLFVQEQYAAAIYAYQKAQGALPTELKQLAQKGQNGEVFLRRLYVDPLTPKAKLEDWCLLQMGAGGTVVSSCAAAAGTAGTQGTGKDQGKKSSGDSASGRSSTSGSTSGFGTSTGGFGTSTGAFGDATQSGGIQLPGAAGAPGTGAVGAAIIGVASKCKDQSYNTVRRNERTYDRWFYTVDDYQKELASKSIPGLPAKTGPAPRGTTTGATGSTGSTTGTSGSTFGGTIGSLGSTSGDATPKE